MKSTRNILKQVSFAHCQNSIYVRHHTNSLALARFELLVPSPPPGSAKSKNESSLISTPPLSLFDTDTDNFNSFLVHILKITWINSVCLIEIYVMGHVLIFYKISEILFDFHFKLWINVGQYEMK